MSTFNKLRVGVAAAGFGAAMLLAPVVAQAKEVHIRVQAVLGTQTSEVAMLREFMDDVTALTGGEVTFEVLPILLQVLRLIVSIQRLKILHFKTAPFGLFTKKIVVLLFTKFYITLRKWVTCLG